MPFTFNIAGQVGQIKLSTSKALWPLFETVINSIQSLEDTDISSKEITIDAIRLGNRQLMMDENGKQIEEPSRFDSFVVTDNGQGFNTENYKSFLEAYSQLKVRKGCKGIGRFLWLKAFESVSIDSIYVENGQWHHRAFVFSLSGITPEDNDELLSGDLHEQQTVVKLNGFKFEYRDSVSYSLDSLSRKLIEHCLQYFIMEACPQIIIRDNNGTQIDLNRYYEETYRDSLNRDAIELKGHKFTLYHMRLKEGTERHELHLCANSREVKSYPLTTYIPNMQKRLVEGETAYYYIGYLAGDYLDDAVNMERSDFTFADGPLFNDASEEEIIDTAVGFIKLYLGDSLNTVAEEKRSELITLSGQNAPSTVSCLTVFQKYMIESLQDCLTKSLILIYINSNKDGNLILPRKSKR